MNRIDRHRQPVRVSAPGRLCLLGEHQDYLGLEVISGALNLRVHLEAIPDETENILTVHLTQTGEYRRMAIHHTEALTARDYLHSGLNYMLSRGARIQTGWRITVTGDLPIGKGVSSSSALCVGWIMLLAAISDPPPDLTTADFARAAHHIEVTQFNEPGGMQDHIASAFGGLMHMDFMNHPDRFPQLTPLRSFPEGFLLVDSGQPKETLGMISRIRTRVETQYAALPSPEQKQPLSELSPGDLPPATSTIDPFKELRATLLNRDLVRQALKNWPDTQSGFRTFLPPLLNAHHAILRTGIESSSDSIDTCLHLCLKSGALAGKVIGSGGGGCLLVYAPDNRDDLKSHLEAGGYRVWDVAFSQGVSCKGPTVVTNR